MDNHRVRIERRPGAVDKQLDHFDHQAADDDDRTKSERAAMLATMEKDQRPGHADAKRGRNTTGVIEEQPDLKRDGAGSTRSNSVTDQGDVNRVGHAAEDCAGNGKDHERGYINLAHSKNGHDILNDVLRFAATAES